MFISSSPEAQKLDQDTHIPTDNSAHPLDETPLDTPPTETQDDENYTTYEHEDGESKDEERSQENIKIDLDVEESETEKSGRIFWLQN